MAYTALYREFRPKTFGEMVGQEHITQTLKNQIISNRVGHAYLFNGGRGTGKTSAAKILSRAINCLNSQNGEPCNECEICRGIMSGSITDVVEMDAASNNGVEDIRSIREEVNFLPTIAKYRVYIIDEVHMLSTGAFNALLKTLEEPPEHVKFILATTEPQKLPATILSRCQRFDFKRIGNVDIIKRLKIVCKESKIEITEEALKTIAILSEGAMRDALSILERCVQDGVKNINEDYIKELVGIPKLVYIKQILEGIINYEVEKVLEVSNIILEDGKDITNFIWELIKFAKDLLIYKTSNKLELYSEEDLKDIKKITANTDKDRLLGIVYSLSEIANDVKTSSQKLIIFQAGLIKLCNKENGNLNSDLERRIIEIENKIKNGITVSNNTSVSTKIQENIQNVKTVNKQQSSSVQNSVVNKKANVKAGSVSEQWPDIINELKNNGKIMLYTNLINTNLVEVNDMTIGIEFPTGLTDFRKRMLDIPENKNELVKVLSIASGKEMNIKYIDLKANSEIQNKVDNSIEGMMSNLDIPFNVID